MTQVVQTLGPVYWNGKLIGWRKKNGWPTAAGSKGDLYYFRHYSKESAEAYVAANAEHYDHPGWIEPAGAFWLSVVDLGPAIRRAEEMLKNG